LVVLAAAGVLAACSDKEKPRAADPLETGGAAGTGASAGTSGNAGNAGKGGADSGGGGAAGDASTDRDEGGAGDSSTDGGTGGGGSDAGGAAGSSAGSSAGGAGGTLALPCKADAAFPAKALAYSAPTPDALMTALGELTYAATATPFMLVLHDDGSTMIGAVSATQDASGKQVFPASQVPCLQKLVPVTAETFTTEGPPSAIQDPQPRAFLHLQDKAGAVDIELEHVRWTATAAAQCTSVSVDVQAFVPSSAMGVVLHLAAGDHTLGEYYDVDAGLPSPFFFSFQAGLSSFDFTTLAGNPGCTGSGGSAGGSP
jgi:hypothetical protein